MAPKEYEFSSRELEKTFGRTGLGKAKKLWGKIVPDEAIKKIKEVNSSGKTIKDIYKKLSGAHSPVERAGLLTELDEASSDYVRDFDELKKTHDEAIQKLERFKTELEQESELSPKGQIERIRQRNREMAVVVGWGSIEARMKDMKKAIDAHKEIKQKLKRYIEEGGIDALKGIQEKIDAAYENDEDHAYSRTDKITLEDIATSHDERKNFHGEMSSHHGDMAKEIQKLGALLGLAKTKEEEK